MVGADWADVELVESEGSSLLLVEFIELGGDVVGIFLQIKPVLVGNQQIGPKCLSFLPTLAQLLQNGVKFFS